MANIGADSTAIAWAIAKNQERENSFKQQKSAYRKGVVNGNKGSGSGTLSEKVTFPSDDPSFEFGDPSGFDDDDPSTYMTEPGVFDLSKGIWLKFVAVDRPDLWRSVHIYIESYSSDQWLFDHTRHEIKKDYPRAVVTDQSGKIVVDSYFLTNAGNHIPVYERITVNAKSQWSGRWTRTDEWHKILKYRVDRDGHFLRGYREYHVEDTSDGVDPPVNITTYAWDVNADLHCQEIYDEDGYKHKTVYAGASTEDPGEIT